MFVFVAKIMVHCVNRERKKHTDRMRERKQAGH